MLSSMTDSGRLVSSSLLSELEAFEALKSMDRSNAPGPDGFGPSFYRAA